VGVGWADIEEHKTAPRIIHHTDWKFLNRVAKFSSFASFQLKIVPHFGIEIAKRWAGGVDGG